MNLSFLDKAFQGKNSKISSFGLAALSVLLVTVLYYTQNPFLEAFEAKTYDLRFKNLRGPLPVSPEIAIIAIDDKSIAELGRFPWTRKQYVRLLDRLEKAKPRAVLFDAFFSEGESAAVDQAFAVAIKKASNVVLATTFDFDNQAKLIGSTHSLTILERAARGIGHINFFPEDDGVNRRNLLLIEKDGKQYPSLGLLGAMAAMGEKKIDTAPFNIRLGRHTIPVGGDSALWINFTGPPGNYPRYSFTDVIHGRIAPERLRGKILFIGATALGVYDMRVTPFSGNSPGVEIHATVADNIISGRHIHRSGIEALFDIFLILTLGLLSFYLTMRMRVHRAIPTVLAITAGYLWLSYGLFIQGHWVSMIYPPLAAATALSIGGGFRYLVLERSAREMRAMFSSYLSTKLVSRLENDPDAAKIGGDNKDVTILFTDIKDFTSFSERHTPQEVVTRLNEYLAAMVQVVYQFDGTVDKFIGDGIMIYWGAPLSQPDHAKRAIACALAMKDAMKGLDDIWERAGQEVFVIRGGIQSGEVVAGNVGSHGKKMAYTVIGDTVNQAARLEGTAKYYGVDFLVGDNTYLRTCDSFRYRELDKIRVVGKQVPVVIYELRGALDDQEDSLANQFSAALSLYRKKRWEDAERSFDAILAEFPNDHPSTIYRERCAYFKVSPPESDWDGVFNRRDK